MKPDQLPENAPGEAPEPQTEQLGIVMTVLLILVFLPVFGALAYGFYIIVAGLLFS